MLESLKTHKKAIVATVTSADFVTAAGKASKDKRAAAFDEAPVHEAIEAAEAELEEEASFSAINSCPDQLTGRYKSAFCNATSETFWASCNVRC